MANDLTYRQSEVIEQMRLGWRIEYNPIKAQAWIISSSRKYRLHLNTFNALQLRGLIQIQRGNGDDSICIYELVDTASEKRT